MTTSKIWFCLPKSAWFMVLASLVTGLQGTHVLLDKKTWNCALCLLKSTLLSMIHGVSIPCDWASRYMCFIGWKNPKSAPFFSLKSILLSVIHSVSVPCTWVSRYMYFIGWKKPKKCILLSLKSILLKLCLELLNFPIYSMDFLYINCANYLQCLSYPKSLLLALWLTPLILAALFILMAPSRIHQRLTGIMTRMMKSPWQLCHHLHLSTWFKLLLPHPSFFCMENSSSSCCCQLMSFWLNHVPIYAPYWPRQCYQWSPFILQSVDSG